MYKRRLKQSKRVETAVYRKKQRSPFPVSTTEIPLIDLL